MPAAARDGAMHAVAASGRLHEMDHLRALAMLAGVVFHAALAYSPLMHGIWPTADRQSSAWVDAIVWGLHRVRMPLFFLVSGFFAAWIIARRGGAALACQRVLCRPRPSSFCRCPGDWRRWEALSGLMAFNSLGTIAGLVLSCV